MHCRKQEQKGFLSPNFKFILFCVCVFIVPLTLFKGFLEKYSCYACILSQALQVKSTDKRLNKYTKTNKAEGGSFIDSVNLTERSNAVAILHIMFTHTAIIIYKCVVKWQPIILIDEASTCTHPILTCEHIFCGGNLEDFVSVITCAVGLVMNKCSV